MRIFQPVRPILLSVLIVITTTGCLSYPTTQSASAPSVDESAGMSSTATAIEDSTLAMINAERTREGHAPLAMREDLRRVARAHSEDMNARDFHDHTNPDGEGPFDRIRSAGIAFGSAAENIAWNDHPNHAEVAVRGWMDSKGHRESILNATYTHTGLGVALDGASGIYFTQVFIGE